MAQRIGQMETGNIKRYLSQKYIIVSNRGNKIIDLITHEGTLEEARKVGLIYAPDGSFAIKRRETTERGISWRDMDPETGK